MQLHDYPTGKRIDRWLHLWPLGLLWDFPSGQLLGIADIETSGGPLPYVGLSADLLVAGPSFYHRKIYQWNARFMASLPTVQIPDSMPLPDSIDPWTDPPTTVREGKRLICDPSGFTTTKDLMVADLATGICSPLPSPEGLILASKGGMAVEGNRLVRVIRSYSSASIDSSLVHLIHYVLGTSALLAVTNFPDGAATHENAVPLLNRDGRWIVSPGTKAGERSFFSGHFGQSLPDISFRYGDSDLLL